MSRLVPAILIGAAVVVLLILLMSKLIGVGEPIAVELSAPQVAQSLEPVMPVSPADNRKDLLCQESESEFSAKLAEFRSCDVDADCTIANFGCPFGCVSAVDNRELESLENCRERFKVNVIAASIRAPRL